MNIKEAEIKTELATVPLSSLSGGDVFRFASDSFEDALKADLFFMRLEAPELKEQVKIANLKDGKQVVRDGIHRVVKHESALRIRRE